MNKIIINEIIKYRHFNLGGIQSSIFGCEFQPFSVQISYRKILVPCVGADKIFVYAISNLDQSRDVYEGFFIAGKLIK